MRNAQTIIIKRSGARNTEGGGGGAWKVAFADFTLAMMAFFMVLWLLASADQSEREMVSKTLREYSVFDGGPNPFKFESGVVPLDIKSYPSLIEGIARDIMDNGGLSNMKEDILKSHDEMIESIANGSFESDEDLEVLKDTIEAMSLRMGAVDNVSVEIVPQGLRIRLQDDDDRQMFQRGGTEMDYFFEDVLINIGPMIDRLEKGVVISGHTDSAQFGSVKYGNWELSSERANMARKVLTYGGMAESNLVQVNGMADKIPINLDDPLDSSNRRIEIVVLTEAAERELLGLFDNSQRNSAINKMKEAAFSNEPVTR
jgi:chemotaxis protein MotB